MTTDPRTLLAAALLCGLSACASSGTRFQDRNMDFGSIRTVAVLPFTNMSRDNQAADRVRDVFATSLLATEAVYVVPLGEVARALGKVGVINITTPTVEEAQKLGQALKAEALITGVVKEYGEVRSGNAVGNVVSVSVQLMDTASGKVVWSASTTKGGVSFGDRMLGGRGTPLNDTTEAAVNDLLDKLFR